MLLASLIILLCYIRLPMFPTVPPSNSLYFTSQGRCSCPLSNPQHTTRTEIVISKGDFVDTDTRDLIFKPVSQRNQKVSQKHSPQGLGIQCLTQGPDSSLSLGPLIKQQPLAAPVATLLLLWNVHCDPVKTATRVKQPKIETTSTNTCMSTCNVLK